MYNTDDKTILKSIVKKERGLKTMKTKEITIKTTEELENITAENIVLDVALFSHRKNLAFLIDSLTAEKKAIDNAILEKVEHKKVKNELFYTIISDYTEFDKDKFIKENGIEEYNKYNIKAVHREQVRTK